MATRKRDPLPGKRRPSKPRSKRGSKAKAEVANPSAPTSTGPAVVGLGASAGGLEALEEFFRAAPKDTGLAFVVVQHLERRHPSLLVEILARCTPMPVAPASNGAALEADRVYVIPPNTRLTVAGGILRVAPLGDEPVMLIDGFFRSLAHDAGERAIGVLFSGTGTDGTLGQRAIKEEGGLTIAQAPETAKHPSMPQSAIAAGFIDEVLPANTMPARLLEHLAHLRKWMRAGTTQETEVRTALPKICELLRRSTGHDFSRYKEGTLLRRIRRRIQLLRLDSPEQYLRRLAKDPEEPGNLLRDLLIGVTQFFREPAAFNALAEKVVPQLLSDASGERPVRIWIPGCATGEEVYSIAMLLHERLAEIGAVRPIQLFATDIDSEALATARAGQYRADIAEQVSPERLERFFTRVDGGYQVVKELRDVCVFSVHNLIRDPPFSSLDLISCRNLLIYLEPDLQRKVVPLLHYALRRSGFLFLGSSEELSGHVELFATIDKKHRIFQRKDTLVRPLLDFPLGGPHASRGIAVPPAAEPAARNPKLTVLQSFERMLLEDFAPASAVVDERGEMLCLGGKRGNLLQAPGGLVTTNLLDHAEGTLRHALRTALAEAVGRRAEFVGPELTLEVEGAPHRLRVTVRPAPGAPAQSGLFAVVVEDLGSAQVSKAEGAEALSKEPMIESLESELRTTRADLQASNEELEGAIEELKSSNEELLSTNEELQSANEELQTSKEEVQSVNEELETVNTELRQKVTELGVANSDLQNLFSSTQVATIFLDRELKLARFTPAATTLFHFIDADVGRPLADLAPRFAGTDLLADVGEVLQTLVPVEREIRAGDAWFILRVLPYRTLDDTIAGAVITFADVTKLKRVESALRESERLLKDVIDGAPAAVFLKDLQGRFLTVNKRLEKMLGITREELKGKTDYELFPSKTAELYREHDRQVVESRQPMEVEEISDLPDGHHVFLAGKFPLFDASGRIYGVGAISHDITERKRADDLVRRYADLLRLSQEAIVVRRLGGEIELWNNGAERLFGFSAQEAVGKNVDEFLQTLCPATMRALDATLEKERHWEGELVHRAKDGRMVTVSARMQLVRGEDGIERVLQSSHDVTERKRAEEEARATQARFRTVIENSRDGINMLDLKTGRYVLMSPAQLALTGFTAEEMNDLSAEEAYERVHPDDREISISQQRRVAAGEDSSAPVEYRWKVKSGEYRWFSDSRKVIRDEQGQAIALVGVSRDITEHKRAEEALHEADRQKNEFLAVLSHELRNPLAPIRNSLFVLKHSTLDAQRVQHAQDVMSRQVDQLVHLVDDLLDVTRIARGKIRLEKAPLDLTALVEHTVEDHRALFAEAGIELTHRAQAGLRVDGDRTRLTQVVGNLLQNAAKFTPRGGKVSVSLEGTDRKEAVLRVRDNGVGIAGEVLARLFRPFNQADRTLDRTKGGLGLGLALVKGLVDLHGGEVSAHSEGPDKGAEFTVVLPLLSASTTVEAEAPRPASGAAAAARRVLIIEDNRDAADSLREVLELSHHVAEVAYSSAAGLERARAFRPEIILCDIGLPDITGYEVARAVRADPQLACVTLVALTGYATPEDVARALEAGFDQHLAKPVDLGELERIFARTPSPLPLPGGAGDRSR